MSGFLKLYGQFSSWPLGRYLFSKGVGLKAPYFGTIDARVVDYQKGLAVFRMADTRRVRNHIGTVHAMAMCNLAELCGGMAIDSLVSHTQRWIPQGMNVKYLKKASGPITGTCRIPATAVRLGSVQGEIDLRNEQGEQVCVVHIDFLVSPRKGA